MAFDDIVDAVGDVASFAANPFGLPASGSWQLKRGVFNNKKTGRSAVFFYEVKSVLEKKGQFSTALEQVSDTGGRRLVQYKYPYRDGQAVADLGREGETFVFNIKFFGLGYQTKLKEFLDVVLNSNSQGQLLHPVRGGVNARFKGYEFIHRHDEWNSVTIRATFIEDQTDTLAKINVPRAHPDSTLKNVLQAINDIQAAIQQTLFQIEALSQYADKKFLLSLITSRLNGIIGICSVLLGKLGVTFSSDATIKTLATQAQTLPGGIPSLTSGTVTTGNNQASKLPPVYQSGYDPQTQATITAQVGSFESLNQITPQQAIFETNKIRAEITAAIEEAQGIVGNDGYDIEVNYRELAVQMQEATESCIALIQSLVTMYTVPRAMSLRTVAFLNGLDPDRQNDIEILNPYLPSVNVIPAGLVLMVPIE